MSARWLAIACAALALAVAIGCSSDAFGPVGRGLPPEVTQDSLGIELTVSVSSTQSFEPDVEASDYQKRRALVLGRRLRSVVPTRSDWRASMLMRIDFSENVEGLPLPPVATWKKVSIELQRYGADTYYGATNSDSLTRRRDLDIYTLSAPLDSTMRQQQLSSLLDQLLFTEDDRPVNIPSFTLLGTGATGSVDTLSAFYAQLKGWLGGQPHTGIAIVDRSDSYDAALVETFARFASNDFPRSSSGLLPRLDAGTVWQPHLAISYFDAISGFDEVLHYRPLLDFTHVEREQSASSRIRLGTHPNVWAFLQLELAAANIPTNATITEARLELAIDPEFSLLRSNFSVRAVEATAAMAPSMTLSDLTDNSIARSLTSISAGQASASIDVTEFVQRYVNGLVPVDHGILLVQTSTDYDLVRSLEFFDVDATVDSLRPSLSVEFTPPPDFQR